MILSENKSFLSKNILNKINDTAPAGLNYKISKDNLKIPVYNNISLHSIYNPKKEGERFANQTNDCQIIALGFGAGYHLIEVASKQNIIVIPVNINILADVLSNIDLNKYFNKGNLNIITAEEIPEHFDFFKYKSFSYIIHPVYERIFSKEILNIIKSINTLINPVLLDMNTQRKFGKIWMNNILNNIKSVLDKSYKPYDIEINKKTVLITGAGPSLQMNIELIKKYRSRLFIVATDSSLKILYKNNITTDCVFSFDPQNYTYLHFNGLPDNINLFIDFTSPLKLKCRTTYLLGNHPLSDIIIESGMDILRLNSDTRNIGGAVIDFFKKHFSGYPVITAGIDYGYYKYYSYSKGSFLDEYKLINSDYFTAPDNHDATIYYRENIINKNDKWKTTELLLSYSNSLKDYNDVYSLSDSPYNKFIKKFNMEDIFEKADKLEPKALSFNKPNLDKQKFIEIFLNNINKKNYCLYPYLLSSGKYPEQDIINNVINYISKKLKS